MGHAARGEAWIPLEDWYEFITRYIPKTDGEISYAEPVMQDDCVMVRFAINTDCHPSQEADPPEWLKKRP